jgi:hypothetical protein
VGEYCRAGQATDDNMAHAHCMVDTEDYKHTLRICNTYCFTTETVVARTRLSVTLGFILPVLLHNESIKPLMADSRLLYI